MPRKQADDGPDRLLPWKEVIGRRIHESGKSVQEIVDGADDLSRSAISMILRGERAPREKTLRELAKGLGCTFSDLLADARRHAGHLYLDVEQPGVVVGPFPDGLLLKWVIEHEGVQLNSPVRPAANSVLPVHVYPWGEIRDRIKDPDPAPLVRRPPLFWLVNRSEIPTLTSQYPIHIFQITHWGITLDPCFCLLRACTDTAPSPVSSYYSQVKEHRKTPQAAVRELLAGQHILVEAHTDIEANVRQLARFAGLQIMSGGHVLRYPQLSVGKDALVISPCHSTASAMYYLTNGAITNNNFLVAGGAPQLIAARGLHTTVPLQVVVTDSDILSSENDSRLSSLIAHWKRAVNVIVTPHKIDNNDRRRVVLQYFGQAFQSLADLTKDPLRLQAAAHWLNHEYDLHGGAGAHLDNDSWHELLTSVISVTQTVDTTAPSWTVYEDIA